MKVDEFLENLENFNPEKWDISQEYATKDYNSASPIEKYIIYKACATTYDKEQKKCFEAGYCFCNYITKRYSVEDPDEGSELLCDVYTKLWPFMYDQEKQKFWSDTMTSVQYTMADLFEHFVESSEEKERRRNFSKRQKCTIRYMLDYFARLADQGSEDKIINYAANELKKIDKIDLFLSAWHTLGNYCPVPPGFNAARSCFGKYDFWDFTLFWIRKWYLEKNIETQKKILKENLFHSNKTANLEACEKWLRHFGEDECGWELFVNTFLFQDWVYEDTAEEHTYYEVIPLSPNHTPTHPVKSFDENELKEFFNNYNNRIVRRSERIIKELRFLQPLFEAKKEETLANQ